LILKDTILVVLDVQGRNGFIKKEKREQAPAGNAWISTPLSVSRNKESQGKILVVSRVVHKKRDESARCGSRPVRHPIQKLASPAFAPSETL